MEIDESRSGIDLGSVRESKSHNKKLKISGNTKFKHITQNQNLKSHEISFWGVEGTQYIWDKPPPESQGQLQGAEAPLHKIYRGFEGEALTPQVGCLADGLQISRNTRPPPGKVDGHPTGPYPPSCLQAPSAFVELLSVSCYFLSFFKRLTLYFLFHLADPAWDRGS